MSRFSLFYKLDYSDHKLHTWPQLFFTNRVKFSNLYDRKEASKWISLPEKSLNHDLSSEWMHAWARPQRGAEKWRLPLTLAVREEEVLRNYSQLRIWEGWSASTRLFPINDSRKRSNEGHAGFDDISLGAELRRIWQIAVKVSRVLRVTLANPAGQTFSQLILQRPGSINLPSR